MNYAVVAEALGLKKSIDNPLQLVERIRDGFTKKNLLHLAAFINIPSKEIIKNLAISDRSFYRYPSNHKLSPHLSDQLFQFAKVFAKCKEVFEDTEAIVTWLHYPSVPLGNVPPINLLDTSTGIELVLDELGRMEHGIFA